MNIIRLSLTLPFFVAVDAKTIRAAAPKFNYAKYSNKVDLAEEVTPEKAAPVFNYAKYGNKKSGVSGDFAEGEEEDMPLIFSQAKFEDSGIDLAEGYSDLLEEELDEIDLAEEEGDFAEVEEEDMPLIFSQAKFEDSGIDLAEGYSIDLAEEEGDFAEVEEEDMPLIFSQAKFEDSGIDLAEGYSIDLAEEEEAKPVFNYAKYANKKSSVSVNLVEEQKDMFNYKKYALP